MVAFNTLSNVYYVLRAEWRRQALRSKYACPQFSDHWLKCGFWCLFTLTNSPK